MITLNKLVVGYDKPLTKQMDLKFDDGKIYGILGKSGCGKSTLLKTIASMIKPISGEVVNQNTGMSDTSNSIYTVRAYMEKLPSEMTTAKKQQTVAGILEVSGMSVEVLLADAAKRTEVLTAARDAVIADRDAEIATANADIEALKSAIEVAQAKIKHAEDVKASTKNNVYDELCAIENLVKFCEGMVNQ